MKRVTALANLLFSSSAAVLTVVAGLLLVPLYLENMTVGLYGAWLASGNVIGLVAIFESGLGAVLTQRLASALSRSDHVEFARLTGSGLALASLTGLLVTMLGITLSVFLPGWIHVVGNRAPLVAASILASLATGLAVVFVAMSAVTQSLQRPFVPGLIGLFAVLANVVATLVGLRYGAGVVALGMGFLASALTYSIGYSVYIRRVWKEGGLPGLEASLDTALELFRDARVLFLARIANAVESNIEAPIAAILISPEASAVLVLTGRLVFVVRMFIDRIGNAVFAGIALVADDEQAHRRNVAVREVMVVSTVLAGLGLALAVTFTESFLALWVGPDLYGGAPLLLAIALATFMSFRKELLAYLCVALGTLRSSSRALVVGAAMRVIFVLAGVLAIGRTGIPVGTGVASLMVAVALGRILGHRLGVRQPALYVPGLPGLAAAATVAALWLGVAPAAHSWVELAGQVAGCSLVLVCATLAVDREWATAVRTTGRIALSGVRGRRRELSCQPPTPPHAPRAGTER